MFYYLVMFAVCVVVGLVVLWLYKEAAGISRKPKKTGGRVTKTDPAVHVKGVAMNTTINETNMTCGGEGRLTPKHPARNRAAMPAKSSYWELPEDAQKPAGVHAYPGGSKSESEFWSYLLPADRPGHGTGVRMGRRPRIKTDQGAGIKPGGHGTGYKGD